MRHRWSKDRWSDEDDRPEEGGRRHRGRVGPSEDGSSVEVAPAERIGQRDFLIAAIIGAVTLMLHIVWSYPMLHPSLWEDMAVANGLRPASHVVGGYFMFIATLVVGALGPNVGGMLLRGLGYLMVSGIAIVSYAALREMMAFIMRTRPQRSKRRSRVMQIASVVGAAAFMACEPVWRAGQCFSETTVQIALLVLAVEFFFVFLRKGALRYAYLCALFLGLLTAESVAGIAFLAGFLVINNIVLKALPELESPFFKPAVMAVSKWYMTAVYALSILIGILLNVSMFSVNDGLVVGNLTAGALPLMYMQGYAAQLMQAATAEGWVLWATVCFAPFVVAIVRFPAAADEETFLSYATGIVFLACGLISFSQVAPVSSLWFWSHFPVKSDFLLSTGMLLSATTMAASVTILGVDSLCRNHTRLARQMFGQDDDGDRTVDDPSLSSPLSAAIRRGVVVFLPSAMVLAMLPGRMETKTCAALNVVKDGLAEIVREAGNAEWIFTDGNLDTGIELEGFKQGHHFKCLPLVSRTANTERDVYLRTRGMTNDKEDLFSFKIDVGMGLRSWIRDKPKRLELCAVMMGFDLWKRDGKALPPMGGMLSRPAGWPSEQTRQGSVVVSRDLARRVIEVHAKRGALSDRQVKDALLSVQWRLARMCTYRGEQADLKGDAKTAIAEAEMAKQLNDLNDTYQDLLAAMSKNNDQLLQRLTPREGLQLALVRADFAMGKMYAEIILVADPENGDANFAMGMYYVKERQLTRAEEYLMRCLIRRPDEPSIYNNLAMVQMELGKLDAAELNAQKALKLIPDSDAVKDTLKLIRKAREARANPAQSAST